MRRRGDKADSRAPALLAGAAQAWILQERH